jgi:filamentous hemagglutinin family protein
MRPIARYWLVFVTAIGIFSPPVFAQISSDGSLGTTVSGTNDFVIQGGSPSGVNLYHSFDNFSVPTGGSANFDLTDNPNILNIIGRVTGANPSNIDGFLRILNANNRVNLFLLNSNGIIFGSNARLDIRGSFVAGTAPTIVFEDGTTFDTTLPTPALLTISAPNRFLIPANAGGMTLNTGATLRVDVDQSIALFANQVIQNPGSIVQIQNGAGTVQVTGAGADQDISLIFPVPSGNIVLPPSPVPSPAPNPAPSPSPNPAPNPVPVPAPSPVPIPSPSPTLEPIPSLPSAPNPVPSPSNPVPQPVPQPVPTPDPVISPSVEGLPRLFNANDSPRRQAELWRTQEESDITIALLHSIQFPLATQFTCPDAPDSQFIATGRGGIPDNPRRQIHRSRAWVDLRNLSRDTERIGTLAQRLQPAEPMEWVEAAGWYRNGQGQIQLVSALELPLLAVVRSADLDLPDFSSGGMGCGN